MQTHSSRPPKSTRPSKPVKVRQRWLEKSGSPPAEICGDQAILSAPATLHLGRVAAITMSFAASPVPYRPSGIGLRLAALYPAANLYPEFADHYCSSVTLEISRRQSRPLWSALKSPSSKIEGTAPARWLYLTLA